MGVLTPVKMDPMNGGPGAVGRTSFIDLGNGDNDEIGGSSEQQKAADAQLFQGPPAPRSLSFLYGVVVALNLAAFTYGSAFLAGPAATLDSAGKMLFYRFVWSQEACLAVMVWDYSDRLSSHAPLACLGLVTNLWAMSLFFEIM